MNTQKGPLRPSGSSQVHFLPQPEKADLLIGKQGEAGLFIESASGQRLELKNQPTCLAIATRGNEVYGLVRFRDEDGQPWIFAVGFNEHCQSNRFYHNGLSAAFGQFMAEWSGVAESILVRPNLANLITSEGAQT